MPIIEFRRSCERAGFYSPLADMGFAEQTIEVRHDPLTGAMAIATSELRTKERMFSGLTDWEHAEQVAQQAREACPFCPEKVHAVTPRYPEALVESGRLRRGGVLVFPNLFPLAAVHAVGVDPGVHFLRPSGFTAAVLEGWLGAAVDFAGRAEEHYRDLEHLDVCCNHLLSAGASVVHPHFQVLAGATAPTHVRGVWDAAAAFHRVHGESYWQTLADEEAAHGERLIAVGDGAVWLAPFAPRGNREVMAVVPRVGRVARLDPGHIRALARGLAKVLAWYEEEGLSALNFTVTGGPLLGAQGAHAVVLRVVARSAFRKDYRTDDYFLQKQLGSELVFTPPEEIAMVLRARFGDM